MALGFEFATASGTATAAGIYIPVADLWNVSGAELGAADVQSRVIYGLLEVLANPDGPMSAVADKLGFASTYPNPTGAATNVVNQVYTMTVNMVADLSDNTIDVLPTPVSGVGAITIDDVFPNAEVVAASGAIGGAGIVIPTAVLEDFGGPAHADLDVTEDSRSWFNALVLYLAANATLRTADTASAVVAVAPTLAVTGALPSAAQIAASALVTADNVTQMVLTRGVSITIQKVIDTAAETVAPRHVVA